MTNITQSEIKAKYALKQRSSLRHLPFSHYCFLSIARAHTNRKLIGKMLDAHVITHNHVPRPPHESKTRKNLFVTKSHILS